MRVGSLFSGIGGFELAAEHCGHEVIWQSEIDPYCTALLKERFPGVPNLGDITTIDWSTVERPDIITGGFPCQPHSHAGRRIGGADARNLWPGFAGAIRFFRPEYVIAENVPGILSSDDGRMLTAILGDLAEIGYDAEWDCFSAADFGAAHQRERFWLLAYPQRTGRERPRHNDGLSRRQRTSFTKPCDGTALAGLCLVEHSQGVRDGDGISPAMERRRLHALGNAIVPACAVPIFQRIQDLEGGLA